jgi:hypothetical protein
MGIQKYPFTYREIVYYLSEISGSRCGDDMTVLWDVAPCSEAEIDRRFRRVYCLHHQDDVMEAVSTSETSVILHEITRRNIPEGSYLCVLLWLAFRDVKLKY